jgi:uncharacterized protein YegP (UPF0339 family)
MLDRRTFSFALFSGLVALMSSRRAASASTLTFVVYADKAGEFRWRLKDASGILAISGEGYKAKASAKKAIASLQKDANDPKKLTFELYADAKGEHRFRIKAKNGKQIAASSGSYKDKADAEKAVESIKTGAAGAEVKDES